jgi:hypothetical protein
MPSYTAAFREEVIRKVLSADRVDSIESISNNIRVPTRTIRRWVVRYREIFQINTKLTKIDKIKAVLSTINLPFEDKSVYCRRKGIMPEELEEWELELKDILSTGAVSALEYSKIKKEKEELKKQLLAAEKELERKDKALAEAAALLLLQKKAQDLLEEEDKKLNQT